MGAGPKPRSQHDQAKRDRYRRGNSPVPELPGTTGTIERWEVVNPPIKGEYRAHAMAGHDMIDYMTTATHYLSTFDRALVNNPRAPYVSRFDAGEIESNGMVPVVFGETGCLVFDHQNGDVECAGLFSAGPKGSGMALLSLVIDAYGVNYLECFEPLQRVYGRLGFLIEERYEFDPTQAPEGWTSDLGTPDYFIMRLPK